MKNLHPGMGNAVAERTVLRRRFTDEQLFLLDGETIRLNPADKSYRAWLSAANTCGLPVVDDVSAPYMEPPVTRWETWSEVAERVAAGNAGLLTLASVEIDDAHRQEEEAGLSAMLDSAHIVLSGRHLQHGDRTQPQRNAEVFLNCATAATSFALFLLLLNGSGVGRCYDDDMILVNFDLAPQLRCVLSESHPDFEWGRHESVRDARHKYRTGTVWHTVADSREGWAKAVETWETLAFEASHAHSTLVLDFSNVRPKGAPIRGMQGRPSSGPAPMMDALQKCATIKGSGLPPWLQAMYIDHCLAECVLVGGARRAARMAVKHWADKDILGFIEVKRPIEYRGLSLAQVIELRRKHSTSGKPPHLSYLWSSNNSVGVDAEFWSAVRKAKELLKSGDDPEKLLNGRDVLAWKVFNRICECAYGDGTGEPGLINLDKLVTNSSGMPEQADGSFLGYDKYRPEPVTKQYLERLQKAALGKRHQMIVNPCGEVGLHLLGGYCCIGDVEPFHCDTLDEAENAFRAATRALIRVNLMPSLYEQEVRRTNRMNVSLTGVHEFAWKFFQVGFRDLICPDFQAYWTCVDSGEDPLFVYPAPLTNPEDARVRAAAFWLTLQRFAKAVEDEAVSYSAKLGLVTPHTMRTVKPAGTTSKLHGLTEGWHLPSKREYLRWVQFRSDDPLVSEYREKGYPCKDLVSYSGTTIVGFPTRPTLCDIGMPEEDMVLASEASPEEQFRWLQLGERYWIRAGAQDNEADRGSQISYTLKYDPAVVGYNEFADMLLHHMPTIRCASVMPDSDFSAAYEYLPEEPLTKVGYEELTSAISLAMAEDIGREHVDCTTGACPINFEESKTS